MQGCSFSPLNTDACRRRDDYYRGDDCYRRGDCRGRDEYRGGLVNRIVGDVIGRRLLNWVEGRDEPRSSF